jgi:preprotein translocase subunit SecB
LPDDPVPVPAFDIADAITRAGFPPIHLAEINFQALYEQRLAQLQQQAGAAGAPNGTTLN